MKSVAFLSLLSLAAAAVIDQREESCAAPSSTVTSTITVAAAAAATSAAAALDVCSGEPETITSTVTVSAGATGACTVVATTVLATDAAAISASLVSSASASVTVGATTAVDGVNVQLFTGTLGGPAPPVVSGTGNRPFTVNGNTFVGSGAAIGRSCDIQHNACANAANSGAITGGVSQCDAQGSECRAFNSLRKRAAGRTFENFHVIRRNNKNGKGNKGVNAAAATGATTTEPALATGTIGAVVMSITSCA
ncbi:hypothetical protein F503_05797 [Ophiostoma piceae UAMH 11346]|uniref:Uncharacterized protein n=1 Tax=Ophiostoma piceae (strain UAMH 11346) TaxID=1262450 RepID=S3CCR6_OPHP1|nr:hypothetical protein F503_05797 [Ophiostoma piceae UAMH 11346]